MAQETVKTRSCLVLLTLLLSLHSRSLRYRSGAYKSSLPRILCINASSQTITAMDTHELAAKPPAPSLARDSNSQLQRGTERARGDLSTIKQLCRPAIPSTSGRARDTSTPSTTNTFATIDASRLPHPPTFSLTIYNKNDTRAGCNVPHAPHKLYERP
jgi:hypothetical protein